MSFEKIKLTHRELKPNISLSIETIENIGQPIALALYVWVQICMHDGLHVVPEIIEIIKEQFGLTESFILEHLRPLIENGPLIMTVNHDCG